MYAPISNNCQDLQIPYLENKIDFKVLFMVLWLRKRSICAVIGLSQATSVIVTPLFLRSYATRAVVACHK